jgi:GH24 family phage-related lysozyme (muramidase)
MTYASVRSAAEHIARAGRITPQQLAAFSGLDEGLSTAQKQAFTDLWRAEGSPAVKVVDPAWLAPALKIIREFEGCHLQAYLCPAGVWTAGWGSTTINGKAVRQGNTISQAQADEQLIADAQRFHGAIIRAIPMAATLRPEQQAALVSWTYNVGVGAMQDSTLRRRLLAGDNPSTVTKEELPKWNKADGKPLAGLTRRRAAEVALFTGAKRVEAQQQPAKLSPSSPFTARITPHITLGEFALGQEARRFDHQHQVNTAAELAAFMERCRARFGGKPVIITSGYRPAAINRSVGGASGSEHLYNAPNVGAVDFYIQGESVKVVQDWCDKEWPYSLGYGAPKGFVHLGIRSGRPRVRWDY